MPNKAWRDWERKKTKGRTVDWFGINSPYFDTEILTTIGTKEVFRDLC